MVESSVTWDSGGRQIIGFLQEPSPSVAAKGTWLVCHPIFEERKAAQRILVETGRALTAEGWVVLHFDYRGCGDSEGAFECFSVSDWREDIRIASAWLAARYSGLSRGILGLRLGGTLAWVEAATSDSPFTRAVLWSPILHGQEYLAAELRRKLMKEMLTFGAGRATRDEWIRQLREGQSVDFDGYCVTPTLERDLGTLVAEPPFLHAPPEGLIVGLTPRGRPDPGLVRWAEGWRKSGGTCTLCFLAEPPFWSLIGLVPCERLIRTTCEWIANRLK